MNPLTETILTIAANSEEEFLSFAKRINRKAEKHGMTPISFVRQGEVTREKTITTIEGGVETGVRTIDVLCVQYKVYQAVLSINGWSMVATVEQTEAGNLIHPLPVAIDNKIEIPACYRELAGVCEHCHSDRARKYLYILRHESGEFKQVGHSCLKDFLGHDVTQFEFSAFVSEEISDWADAWDNTSAPVRAYGLTQVMETAAAAVRKFGFVSRKSAEEGRGTPTSAIVETQLSGRCDVKPLTPEDFTDETKAQAATVETWVRSLPLTHTEAYYSNLAIIAKNGFVSARSMGLAVSAISAYGRHLEKLARDATALSEAVASQYVGSIGDKLQLEVTVLSVTPRDSDYGMVGIHKLVDVSGNVLVWFASESATWFTADEKVTIKGTVKAHSEFRGCKQTTLLRVKEVVKKEVAA